MGTCLAGYVYVTHITERRENPWTDRWKTVSNMRKVGFFAAAMWWLGPVFTLSEGMCNPSSSVLSGSFAGGEGSFAERLLWGVLLRQILAFTVPFALGLQWTYLDFIPALNSIKCTAEGLKKMPAVAWAALTFLVVCVVGAAVGNLFFLFTQSNPHWHWTLIGYGVLLLIAIAGFAIFVKWQGTHHLHLHHYQIFALLVPGASARGNYLAVASMAFCMGVAIEGASRWSLAPMFEHNEYTKRGPKNQRSGVMQALQTAPEEPDFENMVPPPAGVAKGKVAPAGDAAGAAAPQHYSIPKTAGRVVVPSCLLVQPCCGPHFTLVRGSVPAACLVNCCYDVEGALCCVGGVTDGILQPDFNKVQCV